MTATESILKELLSIKDLLADQQSDYCDQEGACRILGFFKADRMRKLKKLRDGLHLSFAPNRGMTYAKKDVYIVAKGIDNGDIVI